MSHQPPPIDDGHLIADLLYLAELVAGEKNGFARLACQAAYQIPDVALAHRIQAGRRFVQDEQVWIIEQGSRQAQPLFHPR